MDDTRDRTNIGGGAAVAASGTLAGFAAILAGSALLIALHTMVKHQVLAINFPMRLRWLFHRLMLDQSLSSMQTNSRAA